MGLSQALFSAISGLTNHQRAMDNIGNNLANVNTVAFKKGVFHFRTLLEQTMRGGIEANAGRGSINPITMGLGTQTGSINKDFTQGSLEVTGNQRDLAIEGNGYFVMRQQNNTVYTRDGTFYLGEDGSLLGNDGLSVQGVAAENGQIPDAGDVGDLIVPIGKTGAARETNEVSFTGNLDSDVEVATGLKLWGDDPTVNDLGATLGQPVEDYIGDVNYDTTWQALTNVAIEGAYPGAAPALNQRYVNGGTVETTVALAVYNPADPANLYTDPVTALGAGSTIMDTPLGSLAYDGGNGNWVRPFDGITEGDEVTLNWRKGGRKESATFIYEGDPTDRANTVNSNTLGDLMRFLTGGVDDYANISDINTIMTDNPNLRTTGGVMGTIKLAGKVSTEHTGGLDGYDAPIETGGAFSRSIGTAPYTGGTAAASQVSVVSNLGAENAITDVEFSFKDVKYSNMFAPDLSYSAEQGGSATTNVVVYDSLGNPKNITIQMSLVDRDSNFSTWRWVADSADDTDSVWKTDPNGLLIDSSANVGSGLIRFDNEGRYVSGVEMSETGGIELTLTEQGVNYPLLVSLREGLAADQTQDLDFSNMTQVASDSDFNLREQDGTPPGTLDSFTVTNDGVIQGVFSNGVVESLGRIVLAMIPNEAGMISAGNNLYYEGPSSGAAQIAFAGVGGRGSIRAGQLEGSNVDLSAEFTKLITTQRGFQANARVITTSDEMLVELVNMKR